MKKLYTILAAVLVTASIFSQSPEKMSYQAVVRDSGDNLVTSQVVGMRISILQTTPMGTAVYIETQTPTTNVNGLLSLEIGTGSTSDDFSAIDWSAGPYFIKTETDPTGDTTYTITGTSQLLSVPYALHAKNAENVIGFSGDLGNAYSDYLYWDTISNSWSVGSGEVHIGQNAGESSQGSSAVAIGRDSGIDSQGDFSVAIGTFSGYRYQGSEAVAIGYKSGTNSQGSNAVAIGNLSGFSGQGDNAIAIGALSGIHQTNNSIILNATGSELNSTVSNSLYIAPIREANGPQVLTYDPITKEVTVAPASVAIGDIRGGGVVFWLDSTGLHGLVCAFSDYETEVEWGCSTDLLNVPNVPFNEYTPVGVGAEIGDGFNNTFDILQDCPTAPAALAARSLGPEWFLPSAKELNQMYIHQTTLEAVAGFEEFSGNDYWSSTEGDYNLFAWDQSFLTGFQIDGNKNSPNYVRAVRAF
jgi:hypothetical protein